MGVVLRIENEISARILDCDVLLLVNFVRRTFRGWRALAPMSIFAHPLRRSEPMLPLTTTLRMLRAARRNPTPVRQAALAIKADPNAVVALEVRASTDEPQISGPELLALVGHPELTRS